MTTPRLLGVLRSVEELPLVREELSEFLAARRRRTAGRPESLLGLWIAPSWVDFMPEELPVRLPGSVTRTVRFRETAGVAGVWYICTLESPAGEPSLSRRALLASLAAGHVATPGEPPPAFVPVFQRHAPARKIWPYLECLTAEHPDLVLAPLFQDACSGRLQAAVPGCFTTRGPRSVAGGRVEKS